MKKGLKIFGITLGVTLLVIVLGFFFLKLRTKHQVNNFLDTLQQYQEVGKLNQKSGVYRVSSYGKTSYGFQFVGGSDFDSWAYMAGDYEKANLTDFYASNWETTIEESPWVKGLEKYRDSIGVNLIFEQGELTDWSIYNRDTDEDLGKLTPEEIEKIFEVSPYYHPLPDDSF